MKIKIIYDKEIKPRPIIKDVYKMPNVDQLIKQGFSLHMGASMTRFSTNFMRQADTIYTYSLGIS